MTLFNDLDKRGFIDNVTSAELEDKINTGGLVFYVGYDPTADSLHVGHLAMFNLMYFLQQGNHTPIGLMGGATGMVGDPGGRSTERNLLQEEQMAINIAGLKKQMTRFLDFESKNRAIIANNADWFFMATPKKKKVCMMSITKLPCLSLKITASSAILQIFVNSTILIDNG
ncbi:MAG: hypothetical protein GY786_07735 [Proteobacteria bacterium]|nr:hypothetical protein [Pseudomonadota bacterium]